MSQHHPLFPINLITQWQDASDLQLSDFLLDWLLEPSSLTAKLQRHCQHFRVEVLGQHIEACQLQEANKEIKAGEQVLVREVLLYCDDVPQVFARSILPLTSLTGEEQQLAHLGEQPLGHVLFSNPNLERRTIEISSFNQNTTVASFAQFIQLDHQQLMWGRRSVFFVNDKPLMVAEVFLPGAFAYIQGTNNS